MAETEVKSINGRPVADVTARARIEEIKNAAPGLVFDTVADMEAYIAGNAGTLKVGQDLFIREADVPDYWWDGTAAVPVETELGEVKKELGKLSKEIADKLDANKLPEAINTALAQAKASGEFNGEPGAPGNDYVLTKADKTEIAEQAAGLIDTALLTIIGSGVTA